MLRNPQEAFALLSSELPLVLCTGVLGPLSVPHPGPAAVPVLHSISQSWGEIPVSGTWLWKGFALISASSAPGMAQALLPTALSAWEVF